MFDSGYENCPEFRVLGGVIFILIFCKQKEKNTVLPERFRFHLPYVHELGTVNIDKLYLIL